MASQLLCKAYMIWRYSSIVGELSLVFWFDDNSLRTACPSAVISPVFSVLIVKVSTIFWFDSFMTLGFGYSSVVNSPVLSALVSKLSIVLWLDDNSLGTACPSAVKSPVVSVPVDKLSVFSWFDGFSLGSMYSSSMTFPECSALVGRLNPPLHLNCTSDSLTEIFWFGGSQSIFPEWTFSTFSLFLYVFIS